MSRSRSRHSPSRPPGGAEAEGPFVEPVLVHQGARVAGDLDEPLLVAAPARLVQVVQQAVGNVPRPVLASHPGPLRVELLDGARLPRPVARREAHRVPGLEPRLRAVDVRHHLPGRRAPVLDLAFPANSHPSSPASRHARRPAAAATAIAPGGCAGRRRASRTRRRVAPGCGEACGRPRR